MSNALVDFYRCPEEMVALSSPQTYQSQAGYFKFGEATCFGWTAFGSQVNIEDGGLSDLAQYVEFQGSTLRLPFDASQIVDNLRFERYTKRVSGGTDLLSTEAARKMYYSVRPMLGDSFRRRLQRRFFRGWDQLPFPRWPVDTSVEEIFEKLLLLLMQMGGVQNVPFIWFWPDGASSAAILTHDVEGPAGLAFVPSLMDLDDEFGFKSSYQLVPERRYTISNGLLELIRERQCEVNVHGLDHDGNQFRDRQTFLRLCKGINHYVQEFKAEGFRSACMYRNVDWYEHLNVAYDMSVPNVAHLEPQRGGCCTVFPYFIGGILELPLTTTQDYSLFHILGEYSIDLWKKQIERIMDKSGLISFIAHPDYLLNEPSRDVYKALLGYLSDLQRKRNVWVSRPGDVNRWWRQRNAMKLVFENGKWSIQGEGRERARIAFARNKGGRVVFDLELRSNAQTG